eukprot:NODE_4297_length_688_cov_247.078989.p3 GENE.NODE_4297_length_688_cov_247.078989~~NODE_4297_length_688_cov_247.078989.p3  ORF type:complete len:116 (-),score=55.03 NODE_4297_length_688_cov_247.078989:322-645(-)
MANYAPGYFFFFFFFFFDASYNQTARAAKASDAALVLRVQGGLLALRRKGICKSRSRDKRDLQLCAGLQFTDNLHPSVAARTDAVDLEDSDPRPHAFLRVSAVPLRN